MPHAADNTGRAGLRARIRDVSVSAIAAVIGAVLALAGVYITGWFTYASKGEELRVHLVEIAIGILRADPKEDVAPARTWAIDVIERDSGLKFRPEDRAALLHKPIKSDSFSKDFSSDFGGEVGGITARDLQTMMAGIADLQKQVSKLSQGGAAVPPANP